MMAAGPGGNGLAARVAAKIRSMSTDPKHGHLHIPQHGWGIYPKSAKRPVPFRPEEAKVRFTFSTLLKNETRAPCALWSRSTAARHAELTADATSQSSGTGQLTADALHP